MRQANKGSNTVVTPKTRFFAYTPKGDVVTRNSHNRYTHVVVYQECPEKEKARLNLPGVKEVVISNFNYACKREPEKHAGKTAESYWQEYCQATVDRIEDKKSKGLYDVWLVAGWTSRLDLANGLVAKVTREHTGRNAIILEALKR